MNPASSDLEYFQLTETLYLNNTFPLFKFSVMYRTAWSNQSSHLTSDRLKPKPRPNNVASPKSKGKGKQQQSPSPSKKALLIAVRAASGLDKDPKGGCFCLARTHKLSPYSPICGACGLILCSLNAPQYRCPSCDTVIMTEPVRTSLIGQLESELANTIAKEEEERDKAIEEAQKTAGAFPSLSALAQPTPAAATQPQTHKVLSLTSKKRVIVSSYTTTPVQSRPVSRTSPVPKPPQEPQYSKERPKPERPWENFFRRHDGTTQARRRRGGNEGTRRRQRTRRQRRI
ncbi:hypothetical protein CPB84DRAFT_1790005, partial [Gymnopilus junonius]